MVDIFEEVDEALKQEKLEKFWDEYKNTIITAIVVLIVSTGGTSFYQSWDASRDKTETAALMEALKSDDKAKALSEFSNDTRRGHKAIAQLNIAAVHLKEGDTEKAAEIYTSIAKQKSAPDNFRDLARILAVRFSKDDNRINLLEKLLGNQESPFFSNAQLEAATFYAHSSQDYAKAVEHLNMIRNNDAIPAGIKQQAEALYAVYSQKVAKNTTSTDEAAE